MKPWEKYATRGRPWEKYAAGTEAAGAIPGAPGDPNFSVPDDFDPTPAPVNRSPLDRAAIAVTGKSLEGMGDGLRGLVIDTSRAQCGARIVVH
ncbi:MAG: hypothetical protein VYB54_15735 [Pseudomonadota bacterium]|nr:hypothetical protein [Pseudomonadota bacterium]